MAQKTVVQLTMTWTAPAATLSGRRTGRRTKRGTAATARQANGAVHGREESQTIREWARRNGFEISNQGRIPKVVSEAFEASVDESRTRKTK